MGMSVLNYFVRGEVAYPNKQLYRGIVYVHQGT